MPWVRCPRSRVAHYLRDGQTLCERFTEKPSHPFRQLSDAEALYACSVCRRHLGESEPAAAVYLWIYSGRDFCRGCGMLVEWWLTPNLRWMPINPESWVAPEKREQWRLSAYHHKGMLDRSHFNTCPDAYLFSGRQAHVADREDAALRRYDGKKGDAGS